MTKNGRISKSLKEVLVDVIDNRGRTPKKLGGDFSDEGIPVISAKNVKNGSLDFSEGIRYVSPEMYKRWMSKRLRAGDVLLTSEAPLGKTLLLTSEPNYCLGQRLYALRVDSTQLDSQFFYFLLMSEPVQHEFRARASGSTVKGIRQSALLEVNVQFPPLPAQRAIASVLGAIQEAKFARQKEIALERERKAALMDYLFSHGTKGEPRKRTEIGEIPESWEWVRLEEVVRKSIRDGVHQTPTYVEDGVPFITAKDIVGNKICFASCAYISAEEHTTLSKRVKPEVGDVLLTKVGTVGNVALVDTIQQFSIFVQIALIKPESDKIDSGFLLYALESDMGQKEINRNCAQSTMRFIGVQKISNVRVPVPSLFEQAEIATTLQACDTKIAAFEQEATRLDELFHAMLEELMTGQRSAVPLIDSEIPD